MDRQSSIHEETHPDAGRRKLLKAVAVAGGAVAATALIPGSWVKPIVELGVLPAGAQAAPSGVHVMLSGQTLQSTSGATWWQSVKKNQACNPIPRTINPSAPLYRATCSYNDPLGEFDPETWLLFTRESPCNQERSKLCCGAGFDYYPVPLNRYQGNFSFFKLVECPNSSGLTWWVAKGNRSSNQISATPSVVEIKG